MSRSRRCLFVLAMFPLVGLLILLAGCSPCVSAYAVGCSPFPDAAPRS